MDDSGTRRSLAAHLNAPLHGVALAAPSLLLLLHAYAIIVRAASEKRVVRLLLVLMKELCEREERGETFKKLI